MIAEDLGPGVRKVIFVSTDHGRLAEKPINGGGGLLLPNRVNRNTHDSAGYGLIEVNAGMPT